MSEGILTKERGQNLGWFVGMIYHSFGCNFGGVRERLRSKADEATVVTAAEARCGAKSDLGNGARLAIVNE